ncbi:MAG: pyridoxal-phosphate dependent enzyme, partial [Nitrospirales bacterium]|nr:pyridoxal-phosphate dependent enzyme [Nitrospirales bacterium]
MGIGDCHSSFPASGKEDLSCPGSGGAEKSHLWRGIIERYRRFFPVTENTPVVSLMEGNTPLVRVSNLTKRLNLDLDIYLKFDGANPTGSFKARGLSAAVSRAKELGVKKIIIPTAGNAGGA